MLISIIIVLVSTNVGNHLNNAKELEYNNKINLIVNAGIKYGEERINYIQDETSKNNYINIKISDLIEEGYLDEEESGGIINPKTNTKFSGCVKLRYNSSKLSVSGEYINSCS
jgi:hypothetical protein